MSYRLLSYGLILVLFASFSVPTMAAVCTMTDKDISVCSTERTSDYCNFVPITKNTGFEHGNIVTSTFKDCPKEAVSSCDFCECNFKETPFNKRITIDQAQITKLAAVVVTFFHFLPEPIHTHQEKPRDFPTLYSDTSPIYLMNQIFLI